MDSRADAARAADCSVLGDDAAAYSAHRAEAYARASADHDSESAEQRAEDSSALLVRERTAQAGCAHADAGGGRVRCDARVRAHEARDGGSRGTSRSARIQCCGVEWGYSSAAA